MSTTMQKPVVVVFEHRGQAVSAIDELEHAGFTKDQIGVASPGGPLHEADSPTSRREEHAAA
ncbi:MAG TPA: hypothetical protein VKE94_04610, partial [Gemmataceae bacterium]|nr:hypothetical protein [Gemmataceae bacterium]